ncbi:MAG: PAS domain-containing protein, partial [Rhodospirillaceae bacterium]|nr:PAS domain-containing protein [Rhodospirillaceae bacterium]
MPTRAPGESRLNGWAAAAVGSALAAAALAAGSVFAPLAPGWTAWLSAVSAATASAALVFIWQAGRHADPAADAIAALARLFDRADGPRLITDATGTVLYRNAAAKALAARGDVMAALESRAARDFDGLDGVARLRQALTAGAAVDVEIPLLDPDAAGAGADPEWLRLAVTPLSGLPQLRVWQGEDVTARRAINDILAQERQDLADFLFLLPAGLYSVDVDGAFRFVNQRFAEWLGAEPEALIGTPLDLVLAGSAKPQFEGEWLGEVQFRTAAGETFSALVLQGAFDDAGTTRTRTLVMRGGAVEADESAAQSNGSGADRFKGERFRGLFNAAPVAIAITDAEGLIADCNDAFQGLVGGPRGQLIGAALVDRLVPEDRATLAAALERVIDGALPAAQLDVRLGDAGSARAQASVFLGPLSPGAAGDGAEIEGAVVHLIDTTEQKNLEVQFAQAQKMQAMGQLAGGVAHDFNNLLTAMIGFCDLLLQRHAAGDPSFADIMQIKQNANRAANLVRQLLAFSRKQPLMPRNLNVTDALTEMSHLLTRLIGESIEFRLVHGRDIGLVRVDPGQFDQMIINLAVNARDAMTGYAMSGGGSLTISTAAETFNEPTRLGAETVPPGRYVRITVADTGKGIPPENLARIFEPFFSTKKEVPGAGTGLGLSTVYGIVRQTGGFIQVDSAVGRGATFTIHLPRVAAEVEAEDAQARAAEARAADSPAPAAAPPAAGADRAPPATVLLVEDED